MELRANRPDGLPINKHVYLGEGKEGIRVGLRLSLLDEPTHHKISMDALLQMIASIFSLPLDFDKLMVKCMEPLLKL